MEFYYCIIIVLSWLSFFTYKNKDKKSSVICMAICASVLFLFSGLRASSVGADTHNYIYYYQNVLANWASWFTFSSFLSGIEPGFLLLLRILNFFFGDNPQSLLLVSSLFIIFSISFFSLKNSSWPCFSMLLFVLLMFWFSSMNIMRSVLAYSIMLLGFEELKKRHYGRYLLYVLFAFCFHRVSAVYILLIPLDLLKFTKKNFYFFVAVGLFTSLLAKPAFLAFAKFLPAYSDYVNSVFSKSNFFGAILHLLIPLVVLAVSFFLLKPVYFEDLQKRDSMGFSNDRVFLLLFKTLVLFTIFSSYEISVTILERVASPFGIYLIAYLPEFLGRVSIEKPKYRNLLFGGICFCGLFYFLSISYFRPNWTQCIPYSFFWSSL